MAKFYGKVGYAETTETPPESGVWIEGLTERTYYGDVLKISRRLQTVGGINDDVTVNNEISIVADPYANTNFTNIRYVNWMGVNWKVTNVTIQTPRLILTIGGVYNGDEGPIPSEAEGDNE